MDSNINKAVDNLLEFIIMGVLEKLCLVVEACINECTPAPVVISILKFNCFDRASWQMEGLLQ